MTRTRQIHLNSFHQRRQVMQWLDATTPEEEFFAPLPAHTFWVEEVKKGTRPGARERQSRLAL